MNKVRIRKLNEEGLKQYQQYYEGGAVGNYDSTLLTGDKTSEIIPEIDSEIDLDQNFSDRYHIAEVLYKALGQDNCKKFRNEKGLWDWFSLAFFKQVTGKRLNRQEHYFLSTDNKWIEHRHCIAGPVRLYEKIGEASRLFISPKIDKMGEMLEQTLSRQYLMQNDNFLEVMKKLYQDPKTGFAKTSAASKPVKKKLQKTGEWSKQGYGSSRRLALELQRIRLTFNVDHYCPK